MSEAVAAPASSAPQGSPNGSGSNMPGPEAASQMAFQAEQKAAKAQSSPELNQKPETGAQKPSEEYFDVKVNGRVVKMSKEELINNASMSHAAQQKFREARELSSKIEQLKKTAKENPISALTSPEFGLSKDEVKAMFEKWYTDEVIAPSEMTEEQRKIRDYERKLQEYEAKQKEAQELEQKQKEEQLTAREREYLSQQIVESLDKSGLPKSKYIVQRIDFYMQENIKNGWNAPMDAIIQQVNRERQEMISDLAGNSDYQQLKRVFGEALISKIHKGSLEELRAKRNVPKESFSQQSYPKNEKISMSEVDRRLREMRMGK